ncbi:unnamed protein product [Auanema sp. JU1783]|nr:unnamed protein product [Auanema sp. JU1783]
MSEEKDSDMSRDSKPYGAKHHSASEAESPSSVDSNQSVESQKDKRETRNCTVFENIQYLGCSKIDNPSDEKDMLRLMTFLDTERVSDPVTVSLAVPHSFQGTVTLCDSAKAEVASFPVSQIRYCVRGPFGSAQTHCFAISFTHYLSAGEPAHQCHVFRSAQPDTAGRALYCFEQAFKNSAPSTIAGDENRMDFRFEAYLEIEENSMGEEYALCPLQNNTIKLRRDRKKRVIVQLKQVSGPILTISKCFGMLLAAGRNLKHGDMQLLEMEKMGAGSDPSVYVVSAIWNPTLHNIDVLNTETPRETRVFMTVAVDVILAEVGEPIRFCLETRARVYHIHERFYKHPRVAVKEGYKLILERSVGSEEPQSSNCGLIFVSIESEAERARAKQRIGRSPSRMPTQLLQPAGDDESDSDEPLLSGSGTVCRDCPEELMQKWKECLEDWKKREDGSRPDGVSALILNGVPDVIRGEVWQLLAKVNLDSDLANTYHFLLGKECPSEQVIMRDIHRTFPAHEYFKIAGGEGQESLYKISKSYSLYDEEVSYCQGLSFLAASLLLHMPEEQAFCTLIKIMFDYQLRDLFKLGFDSLHLRFYQLTRLLKDYEAELSYHFDAIGVETHMFASQWFLTLFTAKFPLQMVFYIVDLFLCEGMNTIFHISLALLRDSREDLLQLDFEGALKYFRVTLPRKYRTEASAKALIHKAVDFKLKHKRLLKYEKEYNEMKERERENEDPLVRLQKENTRHAETILRLDRENDDLAHELVTSKIELRQKLDTVEDGLETATNKIEILSRQNHDLLEENKQLHVEYDQIKEMYRREVEKLEEMNNRSGNLLKEYKQIVFRLENDQKQLQTQKKEIVSGVSQCEKCGPLVEAWNADGSPIRTPTESFPDLLSQLEEKDSHVKALEIQLAETKLLLVEAQCKNQDLTHKMMTTSESDGRRWFKKTFRDGMTSLREAAGSSMKIHERSHSSVSVADRVQ